jgi:hypothetical protein
MRTRSDILLATLFTACTVMVASDVGAVGTRHFVMNNQGSFDGGELEGVAIASDGTVSAGFTLANTPIEDAGSVWSYLVMKDGSVLLGTGSGGRIYQVKSGKVTVAAETGTLAVTSLTMGPGGSVIAGTFPGGKLFKVDSFDGKKLQPWTTIKDTEDIWALAYDDKGGNLYAATGPDGKLFRIPSSGNAEVHFDSEEAHLVSVAIGPEGNVYAGSNGEALLYKITAPGRAEVVHDFDGTDVKHIAFDSKGRTLAVSNNYRGSYRGLRPAGGFGGPSRSGIGGGGGGSGELIRFDKDGTAHDLYKNSSGHFTALAIDDKDVPYVGLGKDGKVYSISDNLVNRLELDTEERQVVGINITGNNRFIICSDPVVFHDIKGRGGADAIWTSKVLDAGLRAHYGKIEWDAEGTLEVQTRSGNTKKPDNTWSKWSAALVKPAKITSPTARYLQIRARWSKDPKAVLHEMKVSFITDNMRAIITDISAGKKSSNTGSASVPKSGNAPSSSSTKISLSWKVDNPDNDTLRYRLYYKRLGGKTWLSILEPHVEHKSTSYSWDTSGLPEGKYLIRVDASDELSNPPDKVTKHSHTSRPVIVDNTPPTLTNLVLNGKRLQGTASDRVGPIAAIEFSLVGKKTWYPLHPTDSIYDDAEEKFDVDVSKQVPEGDHLVVVRAWDEAGNKVERTVGRK